MKFSSLLLTVVLSVSILTSCDKNDTPPLNLNAETKINVSYGADTQQKMDIYLPANRNASETKVMVMIHGGGWVEGDKADFTQFVDTLKNRFQAGQLLI